MAAYPYVHNTGNLKSFLGKIPEIGIPEKVTQNYLVSIGFKSTNDRQIISVLKFIGLIESTGIPSDLWNKYRVKSKSGIMLAQAVKKAYSDLFTLYPDANRKDNEALRDFFSSNTSVGEKAIQVIIKTFRALVEMADFESDDSIVMPTEIESNQTPLKSTTVKNSAGVTVNINIELTIPETDNPKVYDLFFEAMKKHILNPQ